MNRIQQDIAQAGWLYVELRTEDPLTVDSFYPIHADWDDLNTVIKETGAEKVMVTHGYTDTYARWLNEQGIKAEEVNTRYGNEEEVVNAEQIP